MSGANYTWDLTKFINQIAQKQVLLPHFQREFTWTTEEQQKRLVASVLTRLPIGSILLLKAKPDEYAARTIGNKTKVDTSTLSETVSFLLDGQQRITVLANVFSSMIHEQNKKGTPYESLKRRFFLKIPRWSSVWRNEESDLLYLKKLDFPQNLSEPDYLTDDIFQFIECRNYTKNDDQCFNPRVMDADEIRSMCTSGKSYYYIPLFLMIPTEETNMKIKTLLKHIWKKIRDEIIHDIIGVYEGNPEEQSVIWKEVLRQDGAAPDSLIGNEDWHLMVEYWVEKVGEFLNGCITQIILNEVVISAEKKARAIDIYEQMNLGGVSLSTFDMVMAHAATKSHENVYDRIIENMDKVRSYDSNLLPGKIPANVENLLNDHNATYFFRCRKNHTIEKAYIEAFLNVLSLYCNNKQMLSEQLNLQQTKRSAILKLGAEDINNYLEAVCTALDRACFFFKTRCGVRWISELNNKLILTVVAFIFMKDEYFKEVKIHKLLEGWYWAVLFSGEYDKDQNANMERHIKKLLDTIQSEGQNRAEWIEKMRTDRVFNTGYFSTKEFLLMEQSADTGLVPKKSMRTFICQYFLSETYPAMFAEPEIRIHNFSNELENLEQHHIIPVGSQERLMDFEKKYKDSVRDKEDHIVNSPLNFVYILKKENIEISSRLVREYHSKIREGAYSALMLSAFNSEQCDMGIDEDKVRKCLEDRFKNLKGAVQNEIRTLISPFMNYED